MTNRKLYMFAPFPFSSCFAFRASSFHLHLNVFIEGFIIFDSISEFLVRYGNDTVVIGCTNILNRRHGAGFSCVLRSDNGKIARVVTCARPVRIGETDSTGVSPDSR